MNGNLSLLLLLDENIIFHDMIWNENQMKTNRYISWFGLRFFFSDASILYEFNIEWLLSYKNITELSIIVLVTLIETNIPKNKPAGIHIYYCSNGYFYTELGSMTHYSI